MNRECLHKIYTLHNMHEYILYSNNLLFLSDEMLATEPDNSYTNHVRDLELFYCF